VAGQQKLTDLLLIGNMTGLEILGVPINVTLCPQQLPEPTIYIPALMRAPLATAALIVRSRTQAPTVVRRHREVMRRITVGTRVGCSTRLPPENVRHLW
jgi:hypothetical protein